MAKLKDITIPAYSKGEEIFNMVTHIVGGALGIAATTLCVIRAALHGNVYGIVGGSIFGAMMILLYTMSSIYHGLYPYSNAKKVFRILDHCSIFVLIAGTYTPMTLCAVRSVNAPLGWTLFGIVWGLSAVGMLLNALDLKRFSKISMILYIGLGWCIIFSLKAVITAIGIGGTVFLVLGGISYTLGALFYKVKKPYMHSVFHIFIVLGSILHFFCIFFYVM